MRRLNESAQEGGPRLARLADALTRPEPAPTVDAGPDADELRRREHAKQAASARREGHAQGMAEAEAEIARRVDAISAKLGAEHTARLQELDTRAQALSRLAEGLRAAQAVHAREAEDAAVEAAYAALLRVLGDKAADRSLMRDLCLQALQARGAGAATLRLSPPDAALMELDAADLQLVADAALLPGQCVLESSRGASETGLDVRLEAMKRAFLDGLAAHRQAQ